MSYYIYITDIYNRCRLNWRLYMTINKRIHEIISLITSGPVLPGGIKSYFNICGTPGCHCKNKTHPQKHGPYHRLSYAVAGKDSSMFIKNQDFEEAEKMVQRFKELKHAINLLALEYAQSYRERKGDNIKFTPSEHQKKNPEEGWKQKALLRQQIILANKVKIRDLEKSRKEWKQKAGKRKGQLEQLEKNLMEQKKTEKKHSMT